MALKPVFVMLKAGFWALSRPTPAQSGCGAWRQAHTEFNAVGFAHAEPKPHLKTYPRVPTPQYQAGLSALKQGLMHVSAGREHLSAPRAVLLAPLGTDPRLSC